MAGSQLKQLKAALKSSGLIGQTNQKKKNQRSKTPSETRRQDREQVINGIRENFNSFDQRFDRTKHDVSVISGGKFVKAGSKQHNAATRAKSTVQKTMRMQYDLEKTQHNKTGGLQDRRFGENDKHLSNEEKMLERFTRERQGSKKKNAFALGDSDDDDDDGGFTLTHGGRAIPEEREFGIAEETEMGTSSKRYVDEETMEDGPPRKKSKKEVMEEIIAKSKFHKQKRQQEFKKAQDDIEDLDDDFGDVMQEMGLVKAPARPQFSTKTPESVAYDAKVRELTYDRRAVPADRTKTDEEVLKEHSDKMKKLEADRMRRMQGLEVDDRGAEGDDLDGDFWAGSENEEEGFTIKEDGELEEVDEEQSDEESDDPSAKPRNVRIPLVVMPESHELFIQAIEDIEEERHPAYIAKIIEIYKPNLAAGNKEKMNKFVGILFEHILYVSNNEKVNQPLVEKYIKIVKKLAESYNETLAADIRLEIDRIQARILSSDGILLKRDLVFFVLIGYLFSTSDHFHLIVTPTLILMNETLSKFQYSKEISLQRLAQGIFISDVLLNYQKLSKRYIPEMTNFVEKALLSLIPEPTQLTHTALLSTDIVLTTNSNLLKNDKFRAQEPLIMNDLVSQENSPQFKYKLLVKLFAVVDRIVALYRDKSILIEIVTPLIAILKHLIRYCGVEMAQIISPLVSKLTNIQGNVLRAPLALQQHKSVAIKTYAPKFEENFNPDKFSYDVNRERAELNKVQNELKKEKKSALRDVRQELRFVATRKIEEKKVMYDAYHKKMANIVNTISTNEGAEKNQYEREKKMRKSSKK